MKKEYRVYVASATAIKGLFTKMSGYEIQSWECDGDDDLCDDALNFIGFCEAQGTVYSLNGFVDAFNIEEAVGMNDYIFITNKY